VPNTLLWHEAVNSQDTELMDFVNMKRGMCTVLWKETTWTVLYRATGLLCCVNII